MSTNEQDVKPGIPAGILNSKTIAQSILSEQRDRRLEPEDLRSRRFGYNPGYRMEMDPVWSGLQAREIPAGCLLLFETSPVSRAKHSVDKDDKTPPNEIVDFLAGEGLNNIALQYSRMGFREIVPLRTLSDEKAVTLFSLVHPRLRECYERGIIVPCMYGPKECECQEQGVCGYCTYVCVTCRFNSLQKLGIPEPAKSTFDVVKESVTVCRMGMQATWNTIVGEVAAAQTPGTNARGVLANMTEDHMFLMRHLHQRTPSDNELARVDAQNKATEIALARQSESIASALRSGNQSEAEKRATNERMKAMEDQIERLTVAAAEKTPDASE